MPRDLYMVVKDTASGLMGDYVLVKVIGRANTREDAIARIAAYDGTVLGELVDSDDDGYYESIAA